MAEKKQIEAFFVAKVGGDDTNLFWGQNQDENIGEDICIIVIAAGLDQGGGVARASNEEVPALGNAAVMPEIPGGIQVVVSRTGTDDHAASPVIKAASTYNEGTVLSNVQPSSAVSSAALVPPPARQLYASPSNVHGNTSYANIAATAHAGGVDATLQQRYQQRQALSSDTTGGMVTNRLDRQQQSVGASTAAVQQRSNPYNHRTAQSVSGMSTMGGGLDVGGDESLSIPAFRNAKLAN